jgi:uncharacterized protein
LNREPIKDMDATVVKISKPDDVNVILGHSHFIQTTEDIYEAMAGSAPGIKFGVAFCEASGPCLVRSEGNDRSLEAIAADNAIKIGAGHCFVVILKSAFPINVLHALKGVSEICTIYCATANPVEVIVAKTQQGRGIIGVIDGLAPKGRETQQDRESRRKFLRDIGYKL